MGKDRRCLVIPEKTWKGFKQLIMHKTGDIKKNDLSKWVVIILNDRIREEQQHAACDLHAMSKEEEMISNLTELMKDISSYFWKLDTPFPFRCGLDIHKKTLKKAISTIRGNDYRTTKKWIERLLEYGFIRKAPSNQYKILNDGHDSYDITKTETKVEPKTEISTKQKEQEFDSIIEGLK